jgi:hypothetical protein
MWFLTQAFVWFLVFPISNTRVIRRCPDSTVVSTYDFIARDSGFEGSDHFTEKSFHRNFLPEMPFDRIQFDRMPFDRNTIWPNRRLTERRLTESSFYRKVIWLIFFQKMVIWPTKNFIWPKKILHTRSFDWKFILPKGHMTNFFSENGHLTESAFDKKIHLTEKNIAHKVVWPKIHLTES